MEIIEYKKEYLEDVKNLLLELEEYIVSIDEDNLDRVHPDYKDKMAILDLDEVSNNDGKCYLAISNDKVIGLIMGIIRIYDEYDYLDYKCPKAGVITELIVTKDARDKRVGESLIKTLENYFKNKSCEYMFVDAFAYNNIGINFYKKHDYHNRMHTMVKKLDDFKLDDKEEEKIDVSLEKVRLEDKEKLNKLMQLYLHDISLYFPISFDSNSFSYDYDLDKYFVDNYAYFIKSNNDILGFVLIDDNKNNNYEISEIFVLNNYKNKGVASLALKEIFDTYKGNWTIKAVPLSKKAESFWNKVVSKYTDKDYETKTTGKYKRKEYYFKNK